MREQQGGSNDLVFSYRVAARRKDGNTERLAKMKVPVEVPEEAPETRTFSSEEIEEIEQLIPSGEPPPEEPPPEEHPPEPTQADAAVA